MNEFEIVTVINRPVEEVFTALQDFEQRTARRRQHDGLRRQVPRTQL